MRFLVFYFLIPSPAACGERWRFPLYFIFASRRASAAFRAPISVSCAANFSFMAAFSSVSALIFFAMAALLTEDGLKKASSVLDRHQTLAKFLTAYLHVPPDIADKDACRIEHIISPETFAGIKKIVSENK